MADTHFEETCPCGDYIKFSGYSAEVRLQIQSWRSIHNRHAHAFAKAKLKDMEKWTYPAYFLPPMNMEMPVAGAETKD